jgi:CheY-like chemotaxis protein
MSRILVIDDESEILELIEFEIKILGHEVVTTNSPIHALKLLGDHQNQFDLVLCDVVMPGKNGIDFAREVNRIPWFEGHIAFMSSYTNALAQEFKDVGVTQVLRKPFDLQKLMSFFAEVC